MPDNRKFIWHTDKETRSAMVQRNAAIGNIFDESADGGRTGDDETDCAGEVKKVNRDSWDYKNKQDIPHSQD